MSAQTLVALTGATGFVGSWLTRALCDAGYEVRALRRERALPRQSASRAVPNPPNDTIAWITGDLHDAGALADLVEGAHAVIHCAGAVRGRRLVDFSAVNVVGTENLGAAVQQHAADARVLDISSLAARRPDLSDYAASKRLAEDRLRDLAGIRLTVLRPPAIYGPGDRELTPVFKAMVRGLGAVPDHAGRFAMLFVEDLARAILAWLNHPGADGGVYELEDGHPAGGYDWDEVREAIAACSGSTIRIARLPRWSLRLAATINLAIAAVTRRAPMLTPGKVRELFWEDWRADGTLFQQATGWRPEVSLEAGLARTLAAALPEGRG